ncbi:response regulator [Ahrensia sp. R2A130]|uniref:response regulator n=1 Tax=Ahrensia sp. R2A130 TaxID=744979 RepID=UPI00210F5382|nr:response regulator [Ahrensia sp. R2A130]
MIVDDDREMRTSLSHLLESGGFEAEAFSQGAEALVALAEREFDAVLSDVRMPGMDGLEFQQEMKGRFDVPFVLMSAHGDIDMAVAAIQEGAYTFLEKPFDPRRLLTIIGNAAELHRLTKQAELVNRRLSELQDAGSAALVRSSLSGLNERIDGWLFDTPANIQPTFDANDKQSNDTEGALPLRHAVAAFEKRVIARVLKQQDGRMDDAAAALGIGRRTLNEKIVKLGLDKDELLDNRE